MNNPKLSSELLNYIELVLDQAKNGISITDPNQEDSPLVYVNQAFTNLFEYSYEEVIGKNCRFLQAEDREQTGIQKIRDAIESQKTVTVILRNYTKSKILVYNEVTISPIFDENGDLKYFLGIQKDVTNEQKLLKQLQDLV